MMKAPSFWYARHVTPQALVLLPLSWLWRMAGTARALLTKPYTSSIPVICVGNVSAGGAGKTPTAIALLKSMTAKNPCFLTRGYGGTVAGPIVVSAPDAKMFGDEAVLLARHAPVIVARDRVKGLKLAESAGFDLVITDDGYQNPSFTKTASVLVFDGGVGVGNGQCMPSGPLRETLGSALPRADAAVIIGDDVTKLRSRLGGLSVFTGTIQPQNAKPNGVYVAFAGIGRPEKFFDTLRQYGYPVAESVTFPDHHPYTLDDMDRLQRLAARHSATLITTEKDQVRLPKDVSAEVLPVVLHIDDMANFAARLDYKVRSQ